MEAPINAIAMPIKSKRSGLHLSKTMPHRIERTMKIPPYAAKTRPKADSVCKVGITPSIAHHLSDTGEGISPDDLPYVFDRFYRADKSRSRASGDSGIGLAIVKQLVESQPGQGATFGFTLPIN